MRLWAQLSSEPCCQQRWWKRLKQRVLRLDCIFRFFLFLQQYTCIHSENRSLFLTFFKRLMNELKQKNQRQKFSGRSGLEDKTDWEVRFSRIENGSLKFVQYKFQAMPGSKMKTMFKRIDVFSTSEMLRYKQEPQYATMTGTILTLVIIGLIGALAYNEFISTITKQKIEWSLETNIDSNPTNITVSKSNLNFGVWVSGLDLTADLSYFTLYVVAHHQYNGTIVQETIPMEECKEQNWNQTQEVNEVFKKRSGNTWLCPTENYTATLGGRWTSDDQHYIQLALYPCDPLQAVQCASSEEVQIFFIGQDNEVPLILMMLNELVRPQQPEAVTYYIQDTHYAYFGSNLVQTMEVQIAKYSIQTDNSLLPIDSIDTVQGLITLSQDRLYAGDPLADYYIWITIKKSAARYLYKRTYTKIDEAISYVGGLIGLLFGLLFVMAPYTELCFELSLANHLMADDDGTPVRTQMNPWKYVMYWAYVIFNFCCSCPSKEYELYERCSDQMQKQLDIAYLMKRINTLQRLVTQGIGHQGLKFRRVKLKQLEQRAQVMQDNSEVSQVEERIHSNNSNRSKQGQSHNQVQNATSRVQVQLSSSQGTFYQVLNQSRSGLNPISVIPGPSASLEAINESPSDRVKESAQSRRRMRQSRLQSRNRESFQTTNPQELSVQINRGQSFVVDVGSTEQNL